MDDGRRRKRRRPPSQVRVRAFFPTLFVRPSPLTRSTGYPIGPPTTELVLDDRCHGLRTPVGWFFVVQGDRRGRNGSGREGDTRGSAAAAGACGAVGAAIARRRVVRCRSHGPRDQMTRRGGGAAAERGTLPGAQALGSVPAGLVRVSHRADIVVPAEAAPSRCTSPIPVSRQVHKKLHRRQRCSEAHKNRALKQKPRRNSQARKKRRRVLRGLPATPVPTMTCVINGTREKHRETAHQSVLWTKNEQDQAASSHLASRQKKPRPRFFATAAAVSK